MKLELKKSIIHGTGVFTKNYIEKGEVIDESFIHKLSKEEWKLLNNNHYANVLDGTYCRFLVQGLPHYYNHSDTPNCEINLKKTKNGFYYLETKSLKEINLGEEITILYFEGVKI